MLDSQKNAIAIDGLLFLPVGEAEGFQRAGNGDAGIVHQHVQLAEGRLDRGDDFLPAVLAGGVLLHRLRFSAGRCDLRRDRFCAGTVQVRDHDGRAFAGEGQRRCTPDAGRRAGNESHFAGELGHGEMSF